MGVELARGRSGGTGQRDPRGAGLLVSVFQGACPPCFWECTVVAFSETGRFPVVFLDLSCLWEDSSVCICVWCFVSDCVSVHECVCVCVCVCVYVTERGCLLPPKY